MKGDPYIYRVFGKSDKQYGWRVHIHRKDVSVDECFMFSAWGGEAEALAAAQKKRDAAIAKTGIRFNTPRKPTKNNISRYVGVSLGVTERGRGQPPVIVWVAAWRDEDGRQRKKSFSVTKWGWRGAYREAVRVRMESTGQPQPKRLSYPPIPTRIARLAERHGFRL